MFVYNCSTQDSIEQFWLSSLLSSRQSSLLRCHLLERRGQLPWNKITHAQQFTTTIYQQAFSSNESSFSRAVRTRRSQRTASMVSIHCDGNCSIQWSDDDDNDDDDDGDVCNLVTSTAVVDCCHDNSSSSSTGSLQSKQFSRSSLCHLHEL